MITCQLTQPHRLFVYLRHSRNSAIICLRHIRPLKSLKTHFPHSGFYEATHITQRGAAWRPHGLHHMNNILPPHAGDVDHRLCLPSGNYEGWAYTNSRYRHPSLINYYHSVLCVRVCTCTYDLTQHKNFFVNLSGTVL